MPSELIRCSDCGAVFKGVPSWLGGAKVKFTCTNCPKRPSRALPRLEPTTAALPAVRTGPDGDIDDVPMDDLEEEPDLELAADDLDDIKDKKEL